MMFKHLEGDCAVLVSRGVYQQCDLYCRVGFLFARLGSGYVRLCADGSTSKDGVRVEALMIEKPLFRDQHGRLCDASVTGCRPLEADKIARLVGHE